MQGFIYCLGIVAGFFVYRHLGPASCNIAIVKRLLALLLLFIVSCDENPEEDGFSLTGSWTITSLKHYTNTDCTGEHEEYTGTATFDDTSAHEELVDLFSFQEFCEASGGTYDGSICLMGDGSLSFDGDDYIEVPHDASLNINDNNGNQGTLMAYIKIEDVTEDSYNRIISKKSIWNGPSGYELEINPAQNIITFLAGNDNFARGELIPTQDWTHVAVTFHDTVGTIYINGINVTFDANIDSISSNEVPLWIGNLTGSEEDPLGGGFYGLMDEIAILDRKLSENEIQGIIENGLQMNSNVVAHWNFSSGSGGTLNDQSSNENNGSITGSVWSFDSPAEIEVSNDMFSQLCTDSNGQYSNDLCSITTTNVWNYSINGNEYCKESNDGGHTHCGTIELTPTNATVTISNEDGCSVINYSR